MNRGKIQISWELLNKILNLKDKRIYRAEVTEYGLLLDFYGWDINVWEGALNCAINNNTFNTILEKKEWIRE